MTRERRMIMAALAALGFAGAGAWAQTDQPEQEKKTRPPGEKAPLTPTDVSRPARPGQPTAPMTPMTPMTQAEVDRIIAAWPENPMKAARDMIAKYGQPHEATPSILVWRDNAPWKYTKVFREEVEHRFPMAHTDLLEQGVYYRVPPEYADEIAAFDGSVYIDRTKGVLSAKCDKEPMNILALNLAHDIITGKRNVEDARAFYAQTATAFKNGEKPAYTQKLNFKPMQPAEAADPDRPVQPGAGDQPTRDRPTREEPGRR